MQLHAANIGRGTAVVCFTLCVLQHAWTLLQADLAPIQRLFPDELMYQMFNKLGPYTLGKAGCVCRQWRIYAEVGDMSSMEQVMCYSTLPEDTSRAAFVMFAAYW